MGTRLLHRVCGSRSCVHYGTGVFQSVVTSMERVCHIGYFHVHLKGPSWVDKGQKGVKVMMYSSTFTQVTYFPPQHPSYRVSAQKGIWSSRLVCFHSSGKEKTIQNQVRR